MHRPPSVTFIAVVAIASGLFSLFVGSFGLELFELQERLDPPRWLTALAGLVQLACGAGMLAGKDAARVVYLWLLALGFLAGWWALYVFVTEDAGPLAYAAAGVKILASAWFGWFLAGPKAMEFFHGGHAHHGAHA